MKNWSANSSGRYCISNLTEPGNFCICSALWKRVAIRTRTAGRSHSANAAKGMFLIFHHRKPSVFCL